MSKRQTGLVIVGASGHGRVILDSAITAGMRPLGFVDASFDPGCDVKGVTVLAAEPEECGLLANGGVDWFVAVGDNLARSELTNRLLELTGRPAMTIVHPSAEVSGTVSVGHGVFVGPRAVINTDSEIGNGVILNTAATVDHDCCLHSFAQVSPGCHLAGNVTVGSGAFLGTGAVVIPGVIIGAEAIVGAGAVVLRDISPGVVAYGNPARVRRE